MAAATERVIPETVTLPSAAVLDAVASLHALWTYFCYVRGSRLELEAGLDSPVGEWCLDGANELQTAAFGASESEGDDDWLKEPLEVERYALADEKLAVLLKLHVQEQAEDVEERLGSIFLKHARRAEQSASRIREVGSIDV